MISGYNSNDKIEQHNNVIDEFDAQLIIARSFVWPSSVGPGQAVVRPMTAFCTVRHTTDVTVAAVGFVWTVTGNA